MGEFLTGQEEKLSEVANRCSKSLSLPAPQNFKVKKGAP